MFISPPTCGKELTTISGAELRFSSGGTDPEDDPAEAAEAADPLALDAAAARLYLLAEADLLPAPPLRGLVA